MNLRGRGCASSTGSVPVALVLCALFFIVVPGCASQPEEPQAEPVVLAEADAFETLANAIEFGRLYNSPIGANPFPSIKFTVSWTMARVGLQPV